MSRHGSPRLFATLAVGVSVLVGAVGIADAAPAVPTGTPSAAPAAAVSTAPAARLRPASLGAPYRVDLDQALADDPGTPAHPSRATDGAVRWSITRGQLPPGLELDSTGVVEGRALAAGTTAAVEVTGPTGHDGQAARHAVVVTVRPPAVPRPTVATKAGDLGVAGSVSSPRGVVSGATVTVWPNDGDFVCYPFACTGPIDPVAVVTTRADGTWAASGPGFTAYQRYDVCVDATGASGAGVVATGLVARCEPLVLGPGETRTGAAIVLALGGQVSGRVLTAAGTGAAGLPVYTAGAAATTDSRGRFTMFGVPAGKQSVCVAAATGADGRAYDRTCSSPVSVTAGRATTVPTSTPTSTPPVGWIRGVIRDSTQRPVPGAFVSAYTPGGPGGYASTVSAADGTYALPVGAAANYQVCAYPQDYTGPLGSGCRAPSGVTVNGVGDRSGTDIVLPLGGVVTGDVTDPTGAAVRYSVVQVVGRSGYTVAYTDGVGHYIASAVAPGDYTVCAVPDTDAGACAGQTAPSTPPATVSVTAGVTTGGISVVVRGPVDPTGGRRTAAVLGRVTSSAGAGIGNVQVIAFQAYPWGGTGNVGTAFTTPDGSYELDARTTGDVTVCFDARGGAGAPSTGWRWECSGDVPWGFTSPPTNATPVTIDPDSPATGVDAVLTAAGGVRGTVASAAGAPVPGTRVTVSGGPLTYLYVDAGTGPDGTFSLGSIPDGTYNVCFDFSGATGSATGWLRTCRNGVRVRGGAFASASTVAQPGGAITGTVRLADGSPAVWFGIDAWGASSGQGSTIVRPDGTFTVTGLTTDSYTVCTSSWSVTQVVAPGSSDGCVGGDDRDSATPVPVTAGTTATVGPVTLHAAGALRGAVRADDGRPLGGARFTVSTLDGSQTAYGSTGDDGSWSANGLDPGAYTVCVDGGGTTGRAASDALGYASGCVGGTGTTYTVVRGSTIATPTLSLATRAAVAGRVTDPTGGFGLQGVRIVLLQGGRQLTTTTTASGWFTLSSLDAGTYTVCADPSGARGGPSASGYRASCYRGAAWRPGSTPPASSTPVTATAGATTWLKSWTLRAA